VSYLERRAQLLGDLGGLPNLMVAFSGGVDSGVLLHAAHTVLGDAVLAVTADSASLPRRELRECETFTRRLGCRWLVLETDELDDPRYRSNRGDRCYFCKHALFEHMEAEASRRGVSALAYGEITDDLTDHRPGARAAGEFSVLAPLRAAGFSKEDVRRYAKEAGLDLASKPSSACLASRIPVGRTVTREALARVERAEDALRAAGFRELRVRHHGELARLEFGAEDLVRAREQRERIESWMSAEGFARTEITAYRRGGAPVAEGTIEVVTPLVSAGRSEARPRAD